MSGGCCKSQCVPQRHVACLLGFLSIVVAYTMRGCLNLLIMEMVVDKANSEVHSECKVTSSPISLNPGTVQWTLKQQANILASFFYGYLLTHVPGGYLSDLYGAKYVLAGSVLLSAVMTVLTPCAVDHSSYEVICIMRFIVGLSQGPLFPAVSTLIARWIPKEERGRAGAFVYSSPLIGNVVCYFATGLITAYSKNWRTVFYIWAALAFIYLYFIEKFCFSLPEEHPYISAQEREMLQKEIGPKLVLKVPWWKIMKDCGCLSIMAAWTGHAITFFFISVDFPKYLRNVLNYNIVETGLFSSSPHVLVFISASIMGIAADWIINKHWLSTLTCRRIFGVLGVFGPAAFCQLAAYSGCDRIAAIVMFHIAMFMSGFCYASVRVNSLDMTINFAGVMSALVNGAGALGFWPIPHLLAIMTPNNTTAQWVDFFWVLTVVSIVTSIIYVFGTKVERAEWDKTD